MRKNPLYRALRVDKMTLAALDAVLLEHEAGRARETVPVLAMLSLSRERVRERALAMASALLRDGIGFTVEVVDGASAVGGGAAPTLEVATALVAVTHAALRPAALLAGLRAGDPPGPRAGGRRPPAPRPADRGPRRRRRRASRCC